MFTPEQRATENAVLLHHKLNVVTRIMTRQYEFRGVAYSAFGVHHNVQIETTGSWWQRLMGSGGYVVRWRAEGRLYLALTFLPRSKQPIDLEPPNLTLEERADRMMALGNVLLDIA